MSNELPEVKSKLELYANAIITGDTDELPQPRSKLEQLLYYIAVNGGSGGGGSYILPTATETIKGGVKVGNTLTISSAILNSKFHIHEQTTLSKVWSIQHNLNLDYKNIVFNLYDSNFNNIYGEIDKSKSTDNLLVIKFKVAYNGHAILK